MAGKRTETAATGAAQGAAVVETAAAGTGTEVVETTAAGTEGAETVGHSLEVLQVIADELNVVLGMNPPLAADTADELFKQIQETGAECQPADEKMLSATTWTFLRENKCIDHIAPPPAPKAQGTTKAVGSGEGRKNNLPVKEKSMSKYVLKPDFDTATRKGGMKLTLDALKTFGTTGANADELLAIVIQADKTYKRADILSDVGRAVTSGFVTKLD